MFEIRKCQSNYFPIFTFFCCSFFEQQVEIPPSWDNMSPLLCISLLNSSGCSTGTSLYSETENMNFSSLWLWIPLNPRHHLWERATLGTTLCSRMSVTLAGRVLSSGFTITLTLPSGKTDDTNEGWLLVSGYQRHTLPPLCYTVPGPTGSHRHCSLRKHTPSDGQRQVRNNMGQINSMIRLGDDSSWDGRLKKKSLF